MLRRGMKTGQWHLFQRAVKVVFTSGYPDTRDADRSEDDDGPEFVRKPYRKSELAAKLTAVLNT
jgi:hypothetical protein